MTSTGGIRGQAVSVGATGGQAASIGGMGKTGFCGGVQG